MLLGQGQSGLLPHGGIRQVLRAVHLQPHRLRVCTSRALEKATTAPWAPQADGGSVRPCEAHLPATAPRAAPPPGPRPPTLAPALRACALSRLLRTRTEDPDQSQNEGPWALPASPLLPPVTSPRRRADHTPRGAVSRTTLPLSPPGALRARSGLRGLTAGVRRAHGGRLAGGNH